MIAASPVANAVVDAGVVPALGSTDVCTAEPRKPIAVSGPHTAARGTPMGSDDIASFPADICDAPSWAGRGLTLTCYGIGFSGSGSSATVAAATVAAATVAAAVAAVVVVFAVAVAVAVATVATVVESFVVAAIVVPTVDVQADCL